MGRPSIHSGVDPSATIKMYLRRVLLDDGGYDDNGTYFGHGQPIFWYADAEGTIDCTVRAKDRDGAQKRVRDLYPKATFFN